MKLKPLILRSFYMVWRFFRASPARTVSIGGVLRLSYRSPSNLRVASAVADAKSCDGASLVGTTKKVESKRLKSV